MSKLLFGFNNKFKLWYIYFIIAKINIIWYNLNYSILGVIIYMSNEITVKLKCTIDEINSILENKGFKIVERFLLDDTYFIVKDIDIKKETPRQIFQKYVLIRNITQYIPNKYNVIKLTCKNKQIIDTGEIINQKNVNCEIKSVQEGKNFLDSIGYKEILNIKENDVVYEKDDFKIAIKDVINGDNLIEIETVKNNIELDTIEKLKVKLNELQLPIDTNDYFVKKAEIELEKIL